MDELTKRSFSWPGRLGFEDEIEKEDENGGQRRFTGRFGPAPGGRVRDLDTLRWGGGVYSASENQFVPRFRVGSIRTKTKHKKRDTTEGPLREPLNCVSDLQACQYPARGAPACVWGTPKHSAVARK